MQLGTQLLQAAAKPRQHVAGQRVPVLAGRGGAAAQQDLPEGPRAHDLQARSTSKGQKPGGSVGARASAAASCSNTKHPVAGVIPHWPGSTPQPCPTRPHAQARSPLPPLAPAHTKLPRPAAQQTARPTAAPRPLAWAEPPLGMPGTRGWPPRAAARRRRRRRRRRCCHLLPPPLLPLPRAAGRRQGCHQTAPAACLGRRGPAGIAMRMGHH